MRRRDKASGLTLVEVCLSIAVLAVSLVGTAAAVVKGAELAATTAQVRCATRELGALCEEVRDAPFDRVRADWDGYRREVAGLDGVDGPAVATVRVEEEIPPGAVMPLLRVEATVWWRGPAGEQSTSVVTYVTDRTFGGAERAP